MLLAILLLSTTFLSACGDGIDIVEWTEEVKLSDDSVIVVWRKAGRKSSGFPDSSRGAYVNTELRYGTEGTYWKSKFGVYEELISFDRVDGSFYLVRYAQTIQACSTKKPEDYAIQIQKWRNGQWIDVDQSEAPLDRIRKNLSNSPWGHNPEDDNKGLLRLDGQDERPYDGPNGNRSTREDRSNPETIQAYFERSAIDPRTKQRAQDLFRWNMDYCGYWQKKIPVSVNPSREETLQRLEEAQKRLNAGKENNSTQETRP